MLVRGKSRSEAVQLAEASTAEPRVDAEAEPNQSAPGNAPGNAAAAATEHAPEAEDEAWAELRAAFDSEPRFIASRPYTDSELDDLTDVPAAVLEIPRVEEYTHGSGVVAIVPWERPMNSFWARLWTTSKLTTAHGHTFFARFPDGDVSAAVRFALAAEVIAVSGLCLLLGPVVWFAVPGLAETARADDGLSSLLLRGVVAGVPILAIAMATLHAVYGIGLDIAARREGARGRLAHALRYGLYSSGWDLVTMPLGLLAVALSDGPSKAAEIARSTWRIPGACSQAFLCGIYGLSKEAARRAHRVAMLSTIAGLLLGLLGCLALAASV